MTDRRTFLTASLLALAAGLAPASDARAQGAWPEKPVSIIVSFPPGGASDLVARLLADKLSESLGQQFVVENKPGAAGTVAATALQEAAPDGHTFMLSNLTPFNVAPIRFPDTPYDPIEDFDHVTYIGTVHLALFAAPSLEIDTLGGFIEAATDAPGEYEYGSSGVGSWGHVIAEHFQATTGAELFHCPLQGQRADAARLPRRRRARDLRRGPAEPARGGGGHRRAARRLGHVADRQSARHAHLHRAGPRRGGRELARSERPRRPARGHRRAPRRRAAGGDGQPGRAGAVRDMGAGARAQDQRRVLRLRRRAIRDVEAPRRSGGRMSGDREGAGPMRIAVVFVGALRDGGFNESALEGAERAQSAGLAQVEVVTGLAYDDARIRARLEAVADGVDGVVVVGGQGDRSTPAVAEAHPETAFATVQGAATGPNLAAYDVRQEESAFLAGCLAAWTTRSGVVAHLSGHRVTPGLKGRAGFVAGLRHADPEVRVLTAFCGTQDDAAIARRWAEAQIAAGAD
ncbi:MAG: BMP family ABC transporter substrate-binding protein, partial [Deinococcus-Thermus bacterium]|nr:BMP family ABC transporter substrate-binding protein [Deinococcota bacterium]